jgi:SAM-dependent methyltransferase
VAFSTEFDQYADSYDRALAEGLSVSGEDRQYFVDGRVNWLRARVQEAGYPSRSVMDYGCGTGSTIEFLARALGAQRVVGVDTSERSLAVARQGCKFDGAEFFPLSSYRPSGDLDLAYCNGVFHHIPPVRRGECLKFIHDSLRPGGLFALWENNPWNPGTRYIMSRVSFDRDAITLTPPEARDLVRSAGFKVLCSDFLFIFPRFLKAFRPAEKLLVNLPLGGQYQILCQKAPS